ncbi:MAG: helix-turn-helix domain-containing protein [Myxococcota bacterium]
MTRNDRKPSRIIFLLVPQVHMLDFAGPLQAIFEAKQFGARYELHFAATTETIRTAQGIQLAGLTAPPRIEAGDMVLVPGMDSAALDHIDAAPFAWLRNAHESGASVGSICTGAFVLAKAGLLDGRECTTHWKLTERLQDDFPEANVRRSRLFVQDERIITSAGVTSGIDMALALIESAHGPLIAARVAREMVVYIRRDGHWRQDSIFLSYRTHLNAGVHRVQDWLITHTDANPNLDHLAKIAQMSPRHLTRIFRESTGITLKTFATQLRLEVATRLLHDPRETVESVAVQCGYQDARQLRRIFKKHFGASPSEWQRERANLESTSYGHSIRDGFGYRVQ